MDTKHIRISDYDYPLPDGRIAKFPLAERDHSKLLVYDHGSIGDDIFCNLPSHLPAGALMVFNNTKVIQARIHFRKDTGALIEVFLLEPAAPADYEQMFQATGCCSWLCLVGNLKKWKEGRLSRSFTVRGHNVTLSVERGPEHHTSHRIDFSWDCPEVTFADILDAVGELPIPPYLNRKTEESDKTTYQTVYSKIKGSVAAPTAGLHFTPELLQRIADKGVSLAYVTLHVGLGTFRPVKEDNIEDHPMHAEFCIVSQETADIVNRTHANGGRVISVGTTSCRTLESFTGEDGILQPKSGWTDIFIYPGYRFKAIDALVTNFHLPESTLIMLVSALAGRENVLCAYEEAVKERYRFFSFGDAMFIH